MRYRFRREEGGDDQLEELPRAKHLSRDRGGEEDNEAGEATDPLRVYVRAALSATARNCGGLRLQGDPLAAPNPPNLTRTPRPRLTRLEALASTEFNQHTILLNKVRENNKAGFYEYFFRLQNFKGTSHIAEAFMENLMKYLVRVPLPGERLEGMVLDYATQNDTRTIFAIVINMDQRRTAEVDLFDLLSFHLETR